MSAWSRNQISHARYLGVTHSIAATTSSATHASAISAQVRVVRVSNQSGQTVFLSEAAVSPTATLTGLPLSPGEVDYFAINPGEKIAAITASGSGTVYLSEMGL